MLKNGKLVARVVIADDDPDTLELLHRALRSPTTEILEAASGAELVQRLADDGPFDLIVTDIQMPWMHGLDVLRSVRAANVQTPALVVTGASRAELESTVTRLGWTRLLRKPFGIASLRQAVSELLAGDD
jgi:two-component system OmpR family response regulator